MRPTIALLHAAGALTVLAVAATACDAQLTTTERVIGLAARPDWAKARCNRPSDHPRIRICHLRGKLSATFEVDWRTGDPTFGQRLVVMADSARWERFQDSTTRAMRRIATLVRCPKPVDTIGLRRPPQTLHRREVWMVNGESRWVEVSSRWALEAPAGTVGPRGRPMPSSRPETPGTVIITTETGLTDGCSAIIETTGVEI